MASDTVSRFIEFIRDQDFPCVGAKAACVRDGLVVHEFGQLNSALDDVEIYDAVKRFGETLDVSAPTLSSLVLVFDGPDYGSERLFERDMWTRLQSLHNLDAMVGETWPEDVSADPGAENYSYSLAGEPYFIVGLHPAASRRARRFEKPALVFNSHRQFEALRADGRYQKIKSVVRRNELQTEGHLNPMLGDFGTGSEARQYSGRKVSANWQAPFRRVVRG